MLMPLTIAPHDADKALIGAAQKYIRQVRGPVQLFVGCAVHCPVVVPGEPTNRLGREHVGIDHVAAKVGMNRTAEATASSYWTTFSA